MANRKAKIKQNTKAKSSGRKSLSSAPKRARGRQVTEVDTPSTSARSEKIRETLEERKIANQRAKLDSQKQLENTQKLDKVKATEKEVKSSKSSSEVVQTQIEVQSREIELVQNNISDVDSKAIAQVTENRDQDLPKLTGILNTNTKILDVLTRMYQSNHDDQDTSINLPVPSDNQDTSNPTTSPQNEDDDKDKDKDKDKDENKGGLLKSLLAGSFMGFLAKKIFGRILKFSPTRALLKTVKYLSKMVTKGAVSTLKYLGKVGLRSLKSMFSFIKTLMPHAKTILKTLSSLTSKGAKVAKAAVTATSKMASGLVKKSGEKIAAKIASTVALKTAARGAAMAIPIAGWVVTAGLTAMDASNGWQKAGESLGIDEDEVTTQNKAASALSSVLTLGIGSDSLTKNINNFIGGERSTIIKRYENMNVITKNTVFNSDVDFTKFKALSEEQMSEVIAIDDFSGDDTKMMVSILKDKIKNRKLKEQNENKLMRDNAIKFFDENPDKLNDVKDTFSKVSIKANNYFKTFAKDAIKYKSGTPLPSSDNSEKEVQYVLDKDGKRITIQEAFNLHNENNETNVDNTMGVDNTIKKYESLEQMNNDVKPSKPDNYTPIKEYESLEQMNQEFIEQSKKANNPEYDGNTSKTDKQPNEQVEAVPNKNKKVDVINTISNEYVQTEIGKTNLIANQIQSLSVSNVNQATSNNDVSGTDRVLNLFSDIV